MGPNFMLGLHKHPSTQERDAFRFDRVGLDHMGVHRESNPSDAESHIVVVRAGQGVPTVNVDGPA